MWSSDDAVELGHLVTRAGAFRAGAEAARRRAERNAREALRLFGLAAKLAERCPEPGARAHAYRAAISAAEASGLTYRCPACDAVWVLEDGKPCDCEVEPRRFVEDLRAAEKAAKKRKWLTCSACSATWEKGEERPCDCTVKRSRCQRCGQTWGELGPEPDPRLRHPHSIWRAGLPKCANPHCPTALEEFEEPAKVFPLAGDGEE